MPIPEKIKIGDKEYVVKDNADLLKLVEEGRTEAKNKLYSEITELKLQIQNLKKEGSEDDKKKIEELETKLKTQEENHKKLETELNETKGARKVLEEKMKEEEEKGKKKKEEKKTEEEKQQEALVAQITGQVSKLFEDQEKKQAEVIEGLKKQLADVQRDADQRSVAEYRLAKLKEVEGLVLPELVRGTTKEEVDQSIQEALITSKKYIKVKDENGKEITLEELEKKKKSSDLSGSGDDVIKKFGEALSSIIKNPKEPDEKDGKGGELGDEALQNLGEMSQEEFRKNKDAIKKQLIEQQKQKEK